MEQRRTIHRPEDDDLRSIYLVEFFGDRVTEEDPKLTHNLNNFLVALLRYPDACPHLRTIKANKYPVWALITQVLVQRNQNTNLVQLEESWLPSLPMEPLLSLVAELLSGISEETASIKVDDTLMRRNRHKLL
jgi:hypothetical protein